MFKALHIKSPSSPGQANLSLTLQPSVTIFVGPNNSGKSLLLKEIAIFCKTGAHGLHTQILDRLDCFEVDQEKAETDFAAMVRAVDNGEVIHSSCTPVTIGGFKSQIQSFHYYIGRTAPDTNTNLFAQYHLGPSTLSIDGASRMFLLGPTQRGDLKMPTEPLSRMLTDNDKRKKWRDIVYDAFRLYPGIDASDGAALSVRFGKTPPVHERSLEDDTLNWMRSALPIDKVSDGVKAFSGILLQLYSGDPEVIIIDEPEAFLHPSLARTLGKELATAANTQKKFVFASTHSADFLMGAIQSGATVNIVRLTWGDDTATARLLPNAELTQLMNDPMLRSVGVLSGLFSQNVIVTEADADRAFYQEVNERLLAAKDSRAIPNALFLNADNHQTVPAIVAPLRKLGIPAAGVVDLDVIKAGGKDWTRQLTASGLPNVQHDPNNIMRLKILERLRATTTDGIVKSEDYFKTEGGITLLSKEDREAAKNFCDDLDKYGLFLVRLGEVEAWLKYLNLPKKTNGWRGQIFTAMGNDPSKVDYVKPSSGDVWDFIGSINSWLQNSKRHGIPD
jgi:AAA domain, putative AbiEii toxin, Type IV TA system